MAPAAELSHLLNPLATSAQLEASASRLDGVPKELEDSIRYGTSQLLQAAGVLLRMPQEIIAQAIIVLNRFWTGPEGGSMLELDAKDVAAACMYLVAKPSAHPASPRQILTTFEYLSSLPPHQLFTSDLDGKLGATWRLSPGHYDAARDRLYMIEAHILRALEFQILVALPHTLCINYLQTMDVFRSPTGADVAKAAFRRLNGALLSPQLPYLTHQPSAIATAAIYLAGKDTRVKLPETEWWEVFDVDREELGFLVVAMQSLEGFARGERDKWSDRKVPLTIADLQAEMKRSYRAGKE